MAKDPAGKKPVPPKTTTKPAAAKKVPAGKVAPTPAAKRAAKPAAKKQVKAPPKTRGNVKKDSKVDAPKLGLTPKQQRFVEEYLVDLNATQAAIRAGYSPNAAAEQGYEHLTKPHIRLAIAEARKQQQERTSINADRVVLEAWHIMTADARELVQHVVGCCRHCYGEGFRRQRTVGEMNSARERWSEKGNSPAEFDEEGGIGFNPHKEPNPECPECMGHGWGRTFVRDTRHFSPRAVALYAGIKQTKDGIEVKMHDKAAAMEKLFKHLGLYEKDNEQKTDPLAALLQRISGGNASGLAPVLHDPEAPKHDTAGPANTLQPREDVGDDHDE